jgi:hypothetical protein
MSPFIHVTFTVFSQDGNRENLDCQLSEYIVTFLADGELAVKQPGGALLFKSAQDPAKAFDCGRDVLQILTPDFDTRSQKCSRTLALYCLDGMSAIKKTHEVCSSADPAMSASFPLMYMHLCRLHPTAPYPLLVRSPSVTRPSSPLSPLPSPS